MKLEVMNVNAHRKNTPSEMGSSLEKGKLISAERVLKLWKAPDVEVLHPYLYSNILWNYRSTVRS